VSSTWVFLAIGSLLATSAAAQTTITTLDSTGIVGEYSAVAFGADGLALVSYYDRTNGDLRVGHCANVACTVATLTTLDSAGDVGRHTAVAIGADGLGLISYYDTTNNFLKVAHCDNVACSSAAVTILDLLGAGTGTAIAIGADDRALIAYGDPGASTFKVAHCVDLACSSATTTPFTGVGSANPAIAVPADGLPVVAVEGSSVWFGKCGDMACTSATFRRLAITFVETYREPSLTIGGDGNAVIALQAVYGGSGGPLYDIRLFRCPDAACTAFTSPNPSTLSEGTGDNVNPSVAMAPGDRPYTAYTRGLGNPSALMLARCGDQACASVSRAPLDQGAGVGGQPSLAVRTDGNGLVSYHDGGNGDLKVTSLQAPTSQGTDLRVTKSDGPDPIDVGQELTYTISILNFSVNDASNVILTDPLPPGLGTPTLEPGCTFDATTRTVSCSRPSLDDGQTWTTVIRAIVTSTAPSSLMNTASVTGDTSDPDSSNNASTATTAVRPEVSIEDTVVAEGNAGFTQASFALRLSRSSAQPVRVEYTTADGTAAGGSDYVATSGAVTFAPGALSETITVDVIGDTAVELDETFFVRLSNVSEAVLLDDEAVGTISEDDSPFLSSIELVHGSSEVHDLAAAPGPATDEDFYPIAQKPYSSYEVVVDAASGDVQPVDLVRLGADNATVLAAGEMMGTGAAVSLRWLNSGAFPILNQQIRVRSGGCTTGCGADDVYRIRAYETTASLARFNNAGSQITVLVLQNPSDRQVVGQMLFWDGSGALVAKENFSAAAHGSFGLNTAALPGLAGRSGTVTVIHNAPFGVLAGKTVALEPTTGFSFDTPLQHRPR
jgi:uncharacterized repeat protein (TIGR01451 family)